jgi:hypothetical protein
MTNEEAKSLTDKGMQLVLGQEAPQNIPLGLSLIKTAAEADYHDAQIAMFLWYSKNDAKLAEYWFHRSEKTKPRPPGSNLHRAKVRRVRRRTRPRPGDPHLGHFLSYVRKI